MKKEQTAKKTKLDFKGYLKLFLIFLKIGAFTFGGGYAMISLLESEFVEKRKWLTSDEFFKIITVSETTPGPIAINSATYIGFTMGGLLGSFIATFAVVLPSFVIIFVISLFFNNLLTIPVIAHAFNGIKAGVAVLILFAGIKMTGQINKKVVSYILLFLTIAANLTITLLAVDFSTIYLILIGGALGFAAYLITNKNELKNVVEDKNVIQIETTIFNRNELEKYQNIDNIAQIGDKNVNDADDGEENKR